MANGVRNIDGEEETDETQDTEETAQGQTAEETEMPVEEKVKLLSKIATEIKNKSVALQRLDDKRVTLTKELAELHEELAKYIK